MHREITNLTGLRGLAAFCVVIYHATLNPLSGFNGAPVVNHGWMAVDVFFVLSGLVMSLAYGRTFSKRVDIASIRVFFWKRFARLYPAYWVIMLAYLCKLALDTRAGHPVLDSLELTDYIGNIAMMTGWGMGITPIITVSWSVSAELLAYAAFPFLTLTIHRYLGSFLGGLTTALIGGSLIIASSASGTGINGSLDIVGAYTLWPLTRCLGGFMIGVAIAQISDVKTVRLCLDNNWVGAGLFFSFLIAASMLSSDLILYLWVPALVLWLYGQSAIADTIFSNRISKWLGDISYSLYLIHPLILSPTIKVTLLLSPWLPTTAAFYLAVLIFVLLSLAFAHFTYLLVEVPGKTLFLRIASRKNTYPSRDSAVG